MNKKIITSEEAIDSDEQITKPCSDCPWRRDSIKGWLGGMTPEEWLDAIHGMGDTFIDCHTINGPQCAGAAIYRANISKLPRNPMILQLPKDKESVFSTPMEFLKHHKEKL